MQHGNYCICSSGIFIYRRGGCKFVPPFFMDSLSKGFCPAVFPPFFGALLLQKLLPRVHNEIKKAKSISFYLWSVALVIVTGKTIKFVLDQENPPDSIVEISIAVLALIICVSQFITGRRLGGRMYNDTVAGGQGGLGQKNTVLAIWMAQTYLNPISSIGPGGHMFSGRI